MRSYFLLCSCLTLTACVNYAGLHADSTPYTANSLATHQSYPQPKAAVSPVTQPNPANWWVRFDDPQLNQIMAVALADSPNLQTAAARVRRAQALTQSANSTLWPSANLDVAVNRQRFTGTSYFPPPFGGAYFYQGDAALNAQYDFDWWGKHREQIAAAISRTKAYEAELAAARLSLSTQIAKTYYQLQSNLAQWQLSKQLLQQQQATLAIVQARTMHGVESAIPVTTAMNSVQATQIIVDSNERMVQLLRYQLATLMGKNPLSTDVEVAPFVYRAQQVALPTNLPANLMAMRPDIIAARWQVEAKAHEVNVSKARFFPDVNLIAFYSYQSIGLNQWFNQNSRDILVQPAVDLPLFDAGLHRADLSARYAEYDMAVGQYNQTILTALRQIGDQITSLKTVQKQLASQNRAVKALQYNYALTNARYQHGIIDYSMVLASQSNLLEQQLYQIQLQTAQIQHVIAMIQALGGDYRK